MHARHNAQHRPRRVMADVNMGWYEGGRADRKGAWGGGGRTNVIDGAKSVHNNGAGCEVESSPESDGICGSLSGRMIGQSRSEI